MPCVVSCPQLRPFRSANSVGHREGRQPLPRQLRGSFFSGQLFCRVACPRDAITESRFRIESFCAEHGPLLPTPRSFVQYLCRPRADNVRRESVRPSQAECALNALTESLPDRGLSRRFLFSSAALVAASGFSFFVPANPARAENVRLEEVESRELQLALEAAIGGNLEEADAQFGQLIEKNRESASMWSNRGSVRLSLGRFQEAAADFTKATELAPYAAVPFLNRAIAFEALGRFEEAADDCLKAISNNPHESAAWFNLGNIEIKRKEYKKALEAYQTAADLSPGIAGYRLREANALFQVGFASDAERLIRSIVRKYPNYAEAHAALAGMLWGEGRLGQAEEQLTQATEWEPNFKSLGWVKDNVEWPPKLLQVYKNFLALTS